MKEAAAVHIERQRELSISLFLLTLARPATPYYCFDLKRGFAAIMKGEFRFRIHRNGTYFPDENTVEVFVLSNGTVRGTCRPITAEDQKFVPVVFNVDPSFVLEMRGLFDGVASSASSPWINVGCGDVGELLTVKHLCPPLPGQELSAKSKFWEMCVSLCDACLDH